MSELKEVYDERGFVVVRNLFPRDRMVRAAAEAGALPERFAHLVSVKNIRCRWQDNVFTGDCTFETFDPVIDLSPACREIALAPRCWRCSATSMANPRTCSRTSSSSSRPA